jgi:hypothetical protein
VSRSVCLSPPRVAGAAVMLIRLLRLFLCCFYTEISLWMRYHCHSVSVVMTTLTAVDVGCHFVQSTVDLQTLRSALFLQMLPVFRGTRRFSADTMHHLSGAGVVPPHKFVHPPYRPITKLSLSKANNESFFLCIPWKDFVGIRHVGFPVMRISSSHFISIFRVEE